MSGRAATGSPRIWRALGCLLFAVVLWRVGPARWWAQVGNADVLFFAAACAMALPLALAKGWRWQRIVRAQGMELTLREAVGIYSAGMLAGAVTPGKMGDLLKVSLLVERGLGAGASVAATLIDRLIDVALVVLLAFGGVLMIPGLPPSVARALVAVAALGSVGVAVLLWSPGWIERLLRRWRGARWADRAAEEFGTFRTAIRALGPRWWPVMAMGTVGGWGPYYAAAWLCSRAVRLDVPLVGVVAAVSVAAVLAMVPVTVAGIGTRDGTFALVLGAQGFRADAAVAISSLVLATMVVNCAVFFLLQRLCLSRGVKRVP